MLLMILVAICTLILIAAIIFAFTIIKTEKSLWHILAEIKYEIVYNVVGTKALLDDYILKDHNVTLDTSAGTGKVALITGGTRGIGLEVVKKLVKCDFAVIIGCRNLEAGNSVLTNIRAEGIKQGDVLVYKLDTSSIKSVKSFAVKVKQNHQKIHLLINNAGKMFGPYIESVDGFESQLATNYLGHFLLTHLLLPEINAAGTSSSKARIVNVSSCAYIVGNIDLDDINSRNQYIPSKAYAQSKLAQILFTNYLNFLLQKEGAPVAVYSIHPGIVNTDLFNDSILKAIMPWLPRLFFLTPEKGSVTTIFTAISHQMENASGTYVSNCQILPTSEITYSSDLQGKLFEFTRKLLDIEIFGKS